jgi:hypothetical protein
VDLAFRIKILLRVTDLVAAERWRAAHLKRNLDNAAAACSANSALCLQRKLDISQSTWQLCKFHFMIPLKIRIYLRDRGHDTQRLNFI